MNTAIGGSYLTTEQRVANGMRLLDEKVPRWIEKIDLESLDIISCHDCIIGQALGLFCPSKLLLLGLKMFDGSSYNHGFVGPGHQDLEREWTTQILKRREETCDDQTIPPVGGAASGQRDQAPRSENP